MIGVSIGDGQILFFTVVADITKRNRDTNLRRITRGKRTLEEKEFTVGPRAGPNDVDNAVFRPISLKTEGLYEWRTLESFPDVFKPCFRFTILGRTDSLPVAVCR